MARALPSTQKDLTQRCKEIKKDAKREMTQYALCAFPYHFATWRLNILLKKQESDE
jgi:hypothetical protein